MFDCPITTSLIVIDLLNFLQIRREGVTLAGAADAQSGDSFFFFHSPILQRIFFTPQQHDLTSIAYTLCYGET